MMMPILNFGCEWLHVASEHKYEIVCYAVSEADLVPIVIYKRIGGSAVWSRPCAEFFDGRFKQVMRTSITTTAGSVK